MSLAMVVTISLWWHPWWNIDTIRSLLIHGVHHTQGALLVGRCSIGKDAEPFPKKGQCMIYCKDMATVMQLTALARMEELDDCQPTIESESRAEE